MGKPAQKILKLDELVKLLLYNIRKVLQHSL